MVCQQLDRNFLGIELNPDYVAIAEKRLALEGVERQLAFH